MICYWRELLELLPPWLREQVNGDGLDKRLREIRLHDLRHTCASLLIQRRTPLIEVQQWLGHSTLSTTADLYAHLEYETKLTSAQTLKKI